MPAWLNTILAIGGGLGVLITAIATIFLWRVTRILAVETKRMADASARPHVVATIEPNPWSLLHADLRVENTGNATAYDIQVSFDPPLENGGVRRKQDIPLQRISVLKPAQQLASYLSEFPPLLNTTYTVTVSWTRGAGDTKREMHSYGLDMGVYKDISQLGAADPLTHMAEQLKKIREDWKGVASGSQHLGVDVFTSGDRLHKRRQWDRERRRRQRVAQQQTTPGPTTSPDAPS
jgi:hypothetical protein